MSGEKTVGMIITLIKSTSRGYIIKPRVIFEQGIN
jgi:hypothetical protein